jgi:hypothetical protein
MRPLLVKLMTALATSDYRLFFFSSSFFLSLVAGRLFGAACGLGADGGGERRSTLGTAGLDGGRTTLGAC